MNIRITTDPMTLHDVPNPDRHPCLYQGDGENGLEIYFEDEDSLQSFIKWQNDQDDHIALKGNDSTDYVAEG